VRAIAEGRFEDAYLIARGPNPFASICGRICGAPCEAACRRGKIPRFDEEGNLLGPDRPIAIRALKRFVCSLFGPETRPPGAVLDAVRDDRPRVCADADEMAALLRARLLGRFVPARGERVAIVGAGPAGASLAARLAFMSRRIDDYALPEWLQLGSSLLSAGFVAGGILALRRSRQSALRLFQRSILISVFVTQVFMFYRSQWEALVVLGFNLLVLLGLGYMRSHEETEAV
jgi:hypothetical protein